MDHTYKKEFKYSHDNPYHDRLAAFSDFVMRDEEAEVHAGVWNEKVFQRSGAPLCAEVGTGYGHFMMDYCADHPEVNFVGMDYRFKRSFNLARKLEKHPTKNFKYLRARGERIHYIFGENELDRVFYFFPDPWPKKRHLKKRLFQKAFLESCYQALKPGGELLVKTDHEGYADWMEEVMQNQELFDVVFKTRDLRVEHPDHELAQYMTKFEKIFVAQGINIKSYVLKSKKPAN